MEGKRSVRRSLCTTLACLVGLTNEKLTIIQNVGPNTTKNYFFKNISINSDKTIPMCMPKDAEHPAKIRLKTKKKTLLPKEPSNHLHSQFFQSSLCFSHYRLKSATHPTVNLNVRSSADSSGPFPTLCAEPRVKSQMRFGGGGGLTLHGTTR